MDLRPRSNLVVARPVRERRGVAIVNGIQPKPVVPNSDHHAVVVIVVMLHGVAPSEGPKIVRVVIQSSNLHYLVRLDLAPGSPASFSPNFRLVPAPRPMRGEIVCGDGLRKKQRTAFGTMRSMKNRVNSAKIGNAL